ncbi:MULTISPECIES: YpzG family protein [Bacillales]|uniref:YpzG family protein n=1 Tax=Bacillales TaxID=1385 RepID=UPI001CD49231|nr:MULTISPECIES: YpzG family protein [Alkalihalobacillus]MCA0989370.1 YpzG family protein [Alkalihalobacillus algicola]
MGKDNRDRLHPKYKDPFQSPSANPKHAHHQVNGETQQAYNDIVLQIQTRKRS